MYDMCTHECGNTARGAHIYHLAYVCVRAPALTHRRQNIIRKFSRYSLAAPVDASIFPARMLPANRLMRFANPHGSVFFLFGNGESMPPTNDTFMCLFFAQQSNGRILFGACRGIIDSSRTRSLLFGAIKIRLLRARRRANGQFGLIEPFILDSTSVLCYGIGYCFAKLHARAAAESYVMKMAQTAGVVPRVFCIHSNVYTCVYIG